MTRQDAINTLESIIVEAKTGDNTLEELKTALIDTAESFRDYLKEES